MNTFLVYIRSYSSERDIFTHVNDYELFLRILAECPRRFSVTIHAFCLMPTGYHLLVEGERKTISKCMRYIHQRFARHPASSSRKRELFEQIHKVFVEKNYFAGELSLFIHAMPYKIGMTPDPFTYEWSSLEGYVNPSMKLNWIDTSLMYEQICSGFFGAHTEYKRNFNRFCTMDISYHLVNALETSCLGSKTFCDEIKHIGVD